MYHTIAADIAEINIIGISADSRKIKPHFAFVALSGSHANGHDYIKQAIDNGAVLIITDTKLMNDNDSVKIPVHMVSDTRKVLTEILACLYPARPEKLYAVTGTNGKTSIADFIRQIIATNPDRKVVSIGTLGAVGANISKDIMDNIPYPIQHTTPDPEVLYPVLDYLAQNGVTDCVIEASSHGLSQHRLAGLKFDCVLFTNLSRDHLDYHKNEQEYFDAKMILFKDNVHKDTVAIIFHNDEKSDDVIKIAKKSKCTVIKVGVDNKKSDYNITAFTPHNAGASFGLNYDKKQSLDLTTKLVGAFQTNNLVMALVAVQKIHNCAITQKVIDTVCSVDGRLDYVSGYHDAAFYVDYAHTPDALEKALMALRPHCTGRLICVFGCGGNRDTGKRPIMGKIASEYADIVILTDDNPRNENPEDIRNTIIAGIADKNHNLCVIPDRRKAIIEALTLVQKGDVVLVAGKGHENGQIICDKTLPFKDAEVIRHEINNLKHSKKALIHNDTHNNENMMIDKKLLWTQAGVTANTGGSVLRPFNVTGIAIDSRDVKPGDLFIALKARRDGHYFIKNAAQYGAVAALVAWKPRNLPRGFPVVYVKNTLMALESLAFGARNRMRGAVIAITGTAGKTSVKEVLAKILERQGITHASDKSFNNHIGVPLSIARMPADTQYGIFEIGMNKAGEIRNLVKMVRPDVAIITTVGDGHREFFNSIEDIAKAKAEIIEGVKAGGTVILNRDIDTFDILRQTAEDRKLNIVTFGKHDSADVRLLSVDFIEETGKSALTIALHGQHLNLIIGLQGEHNALNVCAIMASLVAVKADITEAAIALSELTPASGRGEIVTLDIPNKGIIKLIDESYNANPLSMVAALKNMLVMKPASGGKKIIVLGAMRELGNITEQAHIALKDDIIAGHYDMIYLIGKEMSPLYDALGENQPTILAEELVDILDEIITETTAGSVVMMKGSNSVKLWQLVTHFKQLGNYYANNKQDTHGIDSSDDINQSDNDTHDNDNTDTDSVNDDALKSVS